MLSSSVRRAAVSVQASPIVASFSWSAPRTIVATQALSSQSHQRRCSSSKPSSPADGSKGIAEGGEVPATPAQTRSEGGKKSSKTSSRRKAKDVAANCTVKARDETLQSLPSVPSTHHLKSKEIAASAFFSLHRPISVTSSFPKTVTEETFAAIFTSRTKSNVKTSDVISTLSSTVNKLEAATRVDRWNTESDDLRAAINAESYPEDADIRHLDNNPSSSSLPFPQHILSGKYQPFNPPPPPKSTTVAEESTTPTDDLELTSSTHRIYKATLTIEESTDANGEVTYVAHSSPMVVEEPTTPTRFLDRMNIRQERYDEYRRKRAEDTGLWALSVKRQRKLKMKKHKYKKLMKRTRSLRQRLSKI